MAYISTADVKLIRDRIKWEFPNIKFSIVRQHASTVNITAVKGNIDFPMDGCDLNSFYPENYSPEVTSYIKKIVEIVEGVKENYDSNAGDLGADYPNYNYFYNLKVGRYDCPYVKTLDKV
jgi:hypothetical protein